MDTNKALGIAGILIIIVAAVAAGYLLTQDGGQDDGGQTDGKTVLEYSLDVSERPDCWDLDIEFSAPESGWLGIYLDGEQIVSPYGYPVEYEWSGAVSFKNNPLSFSIDYEPGQDISYIKSHIEIRFSSNFDAVQV